MDGGQERDRGGSINIKAESGKMEVKREKVRSLVWHTIQQFYFCVLIQRKQKHSSEKICNIPNV